MKPSLFKVGFGLLFVGIISLSIIFFEGERISEKFWLKSADSIQFKMNFEGTDVGYYKIFIPEFSDTGVFVQILDQNFNVISDGTVETKMSVGYFDHSEGEYLVKITNISNQNMNLELEFGETNAQHMIIPGIITLAGGILLVVSTFNKLRDYKIAQPDENIS